MALIDTVFGESGGILRRRDFQVILLAAIPYPLGSGVVSPILDSLTGPFGVSAAVIGLMVTAFFAPALVVTPIAGNLADRYGRKPLLVLGLVCFGTGGTLIMATTDFRVVLGLRLLQGAGAGMILPVLITVIGDLYQASEEATAQGVRTATHALSGAASPIIAGALVVFAWQYPFLLYAVAFPIALVVLWRFEEPAQSPRTTDTQPAGLRDLLEIAGRPPVLFIVLAFGIPPFLYVAFLTYNSILVVQGIGGTPQQAGLLAGAASLAVAVAASQAGRITGAFETRTYPLLAAHVALGIGLVAIALAPAFAVAIIGVVFLGSGFGLLLSMYRSILTTLAPVHLRGGVVSTGETVRGVSLTVSPLVIGILIAVTEPALGVVGAVRWMNALVGFTGLIAGVALVVAVRSGLPNATATGPSPAD